MFYVNHLEIWNIEDKIEKSKTTIYRIKSSGIKKLAKLMDDRASKLT
jgi:hypothetical protein